MLSLNLKRFDLNTQTTLKNSTGNDLSPEMKTFYDKALLKFAKPNLVHDQFAQKRNIPKNGGKTIEFRKYSQLPKAMTPLTEGVTPDGQNLNVGTITATVDQYGGYITLSDVLLLTAIDNNLMEAIELLGDQAGRTLDTITREVLCGGTGVLYAGGTVNARTSITSSMKLTVTDIKKAVRELKVGLAKPINGSYVAIVHPDVVYDLMNDSEWVNASQYAGSTQIFEGEIGKLYGVRFVETTEAKVWNGEDLASNSRTLAVNGAVTANTQKTITFDGGTVAENALKGRMILVDGKTYEVASNTTTVITVKSDSNLPAISNDVVIYPAEGGAGGVAVYATIVLGANAYGTTMVEGGGLQSIVKQLGSGGTADPLNQRATAGWKAIKTAEILYNDYMVRIESASTYSSDAN
jgi:N4-gp56 family major capsid protein